MGFPHTSTTTKDRIIEIIDNWKISDKTNHWMKLLNTQLKELGQSKTKDVEITTDNAANVVKAVELLKEIDDINRVPCAAHTLQLVIGQFGKVD